MIAFIYGILSGIATGIGLGGGTVLIILLTVFQNLDQKTAQGINLVFFIPTSIVAIILFIKNKQLKIKENLIIIIGGIIGAFWGAKLANNFNNAVLRKIFGIFILVIACVEIWNYYKNKMNNIKKNTKNNKNEN